jgi:MATE family multidrug resistance protein
VVAAELGWVSMGIVDTIMVGRLGPAAMGAVSVGGVVFYTAAISGGGLMLGLDTLVSQSFGAGDLEDCHRSLVDSFYVLVPASLALTGIVLALTERLGAFGIDAAVLRELTPYMRALVWSTLPLLLYMALRRYLQAMSLVKPVMFTLITANLMNLAGNWVFIFGRLGMPAMGTRGSGWATCVSRIYMAAALAGYAWYYDRRHGTGFGHTPLTPDFRRIGRLLRLGGPAALQLLFEVGVFALVTTLIGRLGASTLAAHQIAMNAATFSFMVPLGVGAAAAVRVGQALGRNDPAAARRAGWTAMLLGAGFMCCAGIVYVAAPGAIIRIYTGDVDVLRAGVSLLAVVAAFQLFDGFQAVATGALRGAGNTRAPMLCHLAGYWGIGLPLGYWLGFGLGWGALGLWAGLCVGIIAIGCALLVVWARALRSQD